MFRSNIIKTCKLYKSYHKPEDSKVVIIISSGNRIVSVKTTMNPLAETKQKPL